MRVYLDYNVYDAIRKNRVSDFREKSNDNYYISVAHVEEYYNEIKNDTTKKYEDDHKRIKELLEYYKTNGILNPTAGHCIRNKKETFDDVLKRVEEYDTRELVKKHGEKLDASIKQKTNQYHTQNSNSKNYSNLSAMEIWQVPEVQQEINGFPKYLETYNRLTFSQLAKVYGLFGACTIRDKTGKLPSFALEKNCGVTIRNNFQQLEMATEFLYQTLCNVGYNNDKGARKHASGIHDTSHTIYGTYCEAFVTDDQKFSKKLQAIYTFLGLDIKVMSLDCYLSSFN